MNHRNKTTKAAFLGGMCCLCVCVFVVLVSAQDKTIVRGENIKHPGVQLAVLRKWCIQKELKLTRVQVQFLMDIPSEASKAVGHDGVDHNLGSPPFASK